VLAFKVKSLKLCQISGFASDVGSFASTANNRGVCRANPAILVAIVCTFLESKGSAPLIMEPKALMLAAISFIETIRAFTVSFCTSWADAAVKTIVKAIVITYFTILISPTHVEV